MKARIKFSKSGPLKFIGHLDVMRYFQKVFLRAEIKVKYSQGYSPHQLISFAAPLGVGLTSDGEYLDIQLTDCSSSEDMIEQINAKMTEGMRVTDFRLLEDSSKNAMSIVAAADYKISVKDGYEKINGIPLYDNFSAMWKAFISQPQITILKKSKKSERMVDIKPLIYKTGLDKEEFIKHINRDFESSEELYSNGIMVYLQIAAGSVENLKPELVMEAFCQFAGIEYNCFAYQIHRLETYTESGSDELKLIPLCDLAKVII